MPSINEIINKKDNVTKLINNLDESINNQLIGDDSPKSYRDEYEGKRERRRTSLDFVQKDKTIGGEEYIEDGITRKTPTETVRANKYRFNFPKKIVRFATAMLFGGKMIIESDEQDDKLEDFKTLWTSKMKMQSKIKELCRTVKIETRAAILFYGVKANPLNLKGFRLKGDKTQNIIKTKIIKNEHGQFTPHFDEYDDMDAFLWLHKEVNNSGDEIEVFDIYTSEKRIRYTKVNSEWGDPEEKAHGFSVIPVVFAEQKKPEWEDVAPLMDGFEVRVSKLGDANDYTGDPLLIVQGNADLPKKNQVGKVLKFEGDFDANDKIQYGDAHYLTHDQLPESNKLEMDTLKEGIYNGSSTPNLTHDQVKGLGNLSGVAIEMLFFDAILKATDDKEIFDPVVSRCISVVKNGMSNVMNIASYKGIEEMDISATFNSPLPTNEKEYIEMLGESVESKIISKKTATGKHPYVKDGEEEYRQILKEAQDEANLLNIGANGETHE